MDNIGTPPSNVTLEEFLRGVFGADDPWVCLVSDEKDRTGWFGGRASKSDLRGPGWAKSNCYYSIGILKPGARDRKNHQWLRGPVIVLDDVVEKTDPEPILEALGEPSYIVQSSPGSEQWGYILEEPITDAQYMARMQKALTIAFYGGVDPGQEALVRYMRPPVGINNKSKHVEKNGGVAPRVTLKLWEPARKYRVKELEVGLDLTPGLNGSTAWREAEGARTYQFEPAKIEDLGKAIEGDEVLTAAAKLGWVGEPQNNGFITVRCPLHDTHSKDDESTGWSPLAYAQGQLAFKCHHTEHKGWGPVTTDQFIETVRAAYDADKGAGAYDKLARGITKTRTQSAFGLILADAETDHDLMQYAIKGMRVIEETVERVAEKVEWDDWLAGATKQRFKARRTICSHLARGMVTLLAAQPGTGKSLLGIATATAISANRPELIGDREFRRRGATILVSNEDDGEVVGMRRYAWMDHHKVDLDRLEFRGLVNKSDTLKVIGRERRDEPVERLPALDTITDIIARERAEGREVALVILDTATTVFKNIEENDNNAQGDAYAQLGAWAREQNVALLIMHHMPKTKGKDGGGGELAAIRGASAIGGSIRAALTLVELSDNDKDRLKDQSERPLWVVMQSAKATHEKPGAWGRRYFRKVSVDVPVEDEDGRPGYEDVGALEYVAKGPDFGFDPFSEEALFRVCEVIARYERDGFPLRARATKGGLKPSQVIADDIMDATDDDVLKTLKRAVESGLVEIGEGPLNDQRNRARVYRVTAAGQQLVEDRQQQALGEDDETPF